MDQAHQAAGPAQRARRHFSDLHRREREGGLRDRAPAEREATDGRHGGPLDFGEERKIAVTDRDPESYQLGLEREPELDELVIRPNTWPDHLPDPGPAGASELPFVRSPPLVAALRRSRPRSLAACRTEAHRGNRTGWC